MPYRCDRCSRNHKKEQSVLNKTLTFLLPNEALQFGSNLPKCRPHRGYLPVSKVTFELLSGKTVAKQVLCEVLPQWTETD